MNDYQAKIQQTSASAMPRLAAEVRGLDIPQDDRSALIYMINKRLEQLAKKK